MAVTSQTQSQKNLETKLTSLETKVTSHLQRSSDSATVTNSAFYSTLIVHELGQWPNNWWLASKNEWNYSKIRKPKNESEIQNFWNEIAESANCYTNKLVDHHSSPVRPLSYKPDLVIVPKELELNSITAWNCIAFGELKTLDNISSNDSKGQLLATMMTTLKTQFVRKSIAGFLSDGVKIQFWRVKRLETSIFQYECVPKMYDLCGDGGKLLLGLLDSSVEDLGENLYFAQNPVIDNKSIQMRFMLGSTPKSDVYAVKWFEEKQPRGINFKQNNTNELYVWKVFKAGDEKLMNTEKTNLEILENKKIQKVTRLIAFSTSTKFCSLLLSPVGAHFSTSRTSPDPTMLKEDEVTKAYITIQHIIEVVQILKSVHKIGICHRDVKINNFFFDCKNKETFLNDWGCATQIDNPTTFAGAMSLAPEIILEQVTNINKFSLLL